MLGKTKNPGGQSAPQKNKYLVIALLSLPFVLGKWKLSVPVTFVLACLFSAGIEYLQYLYSLGRCEVDDVIMNTLGALLGCSARWISHSWKRK